jgi:NADH-quinone oxidoreductase subunit H
MPHDLAGGTAVEVSGPARAAWEAARLSMLVAVAGMASAAFLGGYHAPWDALWLPGPMWLLLKMALVLALLVAAGRLLARMPAPRMLTLLWVVLLPLSFLDLALVGVELLP